MIAFAQTFALLPVAYLITVVVLAFAFNLPLQDAVCRGWRVWHD